MLNAIILMSIVLISAEPIHKKSPSLYDEELAKELCAHSMASYCKGI